MNAASILKELSAAVADSKSEQSQVNGVVRVLSALGYKGAGSPEVHQTTVDRSTFRVYLWRDSPFGDHLILATGPSFVPKLALASDVPAEPGVGVYVRAVVTKDARTLDGAGRMAERAGSRLAAAEDRSARSRARESTRQDDTLARRGAAERDRAEAERAHREAERVAREAAAEEERSRAAQAREMRVAGHLDKGRQGLSGWATKVAESAIAKARPMLALFAEGDNMKGRMAADIIADARSTIRAKSKHDTGNYFGHAEGMLSRFVDEIWVAQERADQVHEREVKKIAAGHAAQHAAAAPDPHKAMAQAQALIAMLKAQKSA